MHIPNIAHSTVRHLDSDLEHTFIYKPVRKGRARERVELPGNNGIPRQSYQAALLKERVLTGSPGYRPNAVGGDRPAGIASPSLLKQDDIRIQSLQFTRNSWITA